MANYFNSVNIVGRAGSDAEIKYFDSGKAKAHVSLAVNRYVSRDNQQTDWFRVEFWDRDAEVASEYIKKGMQLAIEGRINCNKWVDKNGQEQEMWTITVTSFKMLSSKKEMQEQAAAF